MARWFDCDHLPPELQLYSRPFQDLVEHMLTISPDSADLTHGLRQLLEVKDTFVRIGVDVRDAQPAATT